MATQIQTESLTAPGKIRCGDFVLHDIAAPARTHLVALSDGVGAHECDWAASEQACRSAVAAFAEADGEIDERLAQAVHCAHQDVQDLEGKAAGATATLVLVACTEGEDVAHYLSVGDSRLYRVGAGGVELLTDDDSISIPVKLGGEVVIEAGAVKFAAGLTRAIGFGSLGDVEVAEIPLCNGEMLAAVTDGYHELPGFESRLAAAFDRIDLATGIRHELVAAHGQSGRDDATIALLRRSDMPSDDLSDYLGVLREAVDIREAGLFSHLMALVCLRELDELVSEGDLAGLSERLEYMKRFDITPARPEIMPILDRMAESVAPETKPLLDALVELAKRARG